MASITRLEIETGRLQRDIDSLKSYLNSMRQTGDNMMAGIRALSSMWEGEAKEAFTVQFQSDYETLQSMEQIIEDLIKTLEFAEEQYVTCENDVASIISAIRV
jgi:WXG100 family type VII secretion target